jgi:hypothetical protein
MQLETIDWILIVGSGPFIDQPLCFGGETLSFCHELLFSFFVDRTGAEIAIDRLWTTQLHDYGLLFLAVFCLWCVPD